MLSARQLLLMRRARDRAIDIAIAPLWTVVLVPDPDFRRRVFRCDSHVGLTFGARQVGRMDRVVNVGCKSWLWVCHVMRRLPGPSIERNSRRFMLGLPHTGAKSASNRASAASLVPLWRHSRKAGGGNDLNDVRFWG